MLDVPIFAKFYEFYKVLSLHITNFPKIKRYTLGQKLDSLSLEIFELLFAVGQSENKLSTLQLISVKLDLTKVLLRLAKDNQTLDNKKYLDLQTMLYEIGKMLGGWIRATKQS